MKHPLFSIALNVFWILFLIIRTGEEMGDGWYFLYHVNSTFINSVELEFSRFDLWRMHQGLIGILGVAIFSLFLMRDLLRLASERRNAFRSLEGNVSAER